MSFTLPRGRGRTPLLRTFKSNLFLRPRLPVSGSGLSIKTSPFSSHAVLSRLRAASSTNLGNFGVPRRPGCVESVTNMHPQCIQGVRLGSTFDEAGTEKEQGHEKDKAMKAEEAKKEAKKAADEEMDEESEEETEEEEVSEETEEEYMARFPRIQDITVKRKTGQEGKQNIFEYDLFKAYVTLQGRKQDGRKPRVWVSCSEKDTMGDSQAMAEVVTLKWPTGKEGATKAAIFDLEEIQHDMNFKLPLRNSEFQVMEKTLVKGNRRIWREVIQKGEGEHGDGDKGEGE